MNRDHEAWLEFSEPYVCGKCMYLACALNERLGWPISAFIYDEFEPPYISHAWVVSHDGIPYDVDGYREDGDMDEYGGTLHENMSVAEVFEINELNGETAERFREKIAEAHAFIDLNLQGELPKIQKNDSQDRTHDDDLSVC